MKIRRQCNCSSCQWGKKRTSSGFCSELRGVLAVLASFSLALPARNVACVSICCCYVLLMSSLTKPKLMMPPLCCTLCWVSAFHQATSMRCQSAEPLYSFSHCCCGCCYCCCSCCCCCRFPWQMAQIYSKLLHSLKL